MLVLRAVEQEKGSLEHHVNFSHRGTGKLASIFPLVVFPSPLQLLYLSSLEKFHLKKREIDFCTFAEIDPFVEMKANADEQGTFCQFRQVNLAK